MRKDGLVRTISMVKTKINNKGLIRLIEISLILWIKSKCIHSEVLELEIDSSFFKLINGKINLLTLKGSNINFQNILISSANIKGGEIDFKLEIAKRKISLTNPFNIEGHIKLESASMKTIFINGEWSWITDLISNNLSNKEEVKDIYFKNNLMYITYSDNENKYFCKEYSIEAYKDSILIKDSNTETTFLLPMDKSILIKKTFIKNSCLFIYGNSVVRS